MRKSRLTLLALLGFLMFCIFMLTGCNEILSPDLQIIDWELVQGDYWWYAEGTAKNVGGHADLCHVVIKFYDKDDILLGTGGDTILDLDAGETWHFRGGLFDSGKPDHVTVKVGDCY